MKKRWMAALLIVVLLLGAAGCLGALKDRAPKEVALLYVEALRGDSKGLLEYDPKAVPEEDFWFRSLEGQGLTFTREQVEAYVRASQGALGRARIQVVGEAIDGNTAVVRLEITPVDFAGTVNALSEAVDWFGKSPDEINVLIADVMIRSLNEAPLAVSRTSIIEVTLTKSRGLWVLDEASAGPLVNGMILFQ